MNPSKELNLVPEENESNSPQFVKSSDLNLKSFEMIKMKDIGKMKPSPPRGNRSVYLCKYSGLPSKRKPPLCSRSNPSAEAVLRERKVEIKDLESQVAYLQNRIKELKVENKTLTDIQIRHEKELRKFKGGVADIPAILRSHKDEIKALESTASSLRRELWECQKELKAKCDIILRKDQHLEKLNLTIKRNEKRLQEMNLEKKQLKVDKKRLEEESKKLVGGNEELKSKTDRLQKKIQLMTNEILNFEEKLGTAEHFKSQLEDDLNKLQKKYEESLQNEIELKKSIHNALQTVSTQTSSKETVSVACMTTGTVFGYDVSNADSKLDVTNRKENTSSSKINFTEGECCNESEDFPFDRLFSNFEPFQKKSLLAPLKHNSTFMKTCNEHDFGDHKDLDLSKTIASNSSISASNVNNSYSNIVVTKDSYGENKIKNIVTDKSYESKYLSHSNHYFLLNEKQKQKRQYSNFTLRNS